MSPSIDQRENREFATELKFLVAGPVADQVRAWARERLAPDPNAPADLGDAYQITSLYFDTEQFDVFHRRGSFGRSKYRIRRYGAGDRVFLERKLKTRGLLSKRRSLVNLEELTRLANGEPTRDWAGHWYHQRLLARQLKPICEITYRRTARVFMTQCGPIRLTVDDDIHAVAAHGMVFNGAHQGVRISADRTIVELKYRLETPALFKQLMTEFALNPHPVSKYRLAVAALGLVETPVAKPVDAAP